MSNSSNVYFSVIIPTLNRSHMLSDTLDSVRNQSLPLDQYEIIVVDNGSLDDTKELIERFNCTSGKPVYFVREERRGLHWARHTGAKTACGHILAYIDDDCVVEPNWLSELYRAYNELNADAAGGKILIRWDREPPEWVIPYENVLGKLDYGPEMLLLKPGQYINGGNFSILRSRLFEIGGFNPDQIDDYLIGNGETGLCDKIHSAGWKIVWVPKALAWHRQSVDRNATCRDMKRRFGNNGIAGAYATYRKHPKGMSLLLRLGAAAMHYFRAHRLLPLGQNMLLKHHKRLAHEFYAAYYRAQVVYYLRLILDPQFRQIVLFNDWINT